MDPSSIYLTLTEAARYLRVSVSTLRRQVRLGALPAQRVGRQYRFTKEHLDSYTTTAAAQPRH